MTERLSQPKLGPAGADSTATIRGLPDPNETPEQRNARKRAELGVTVPAAPDLTDELLQKSAATTVARLRRGMGRRSTFLDTAVGDSTLLGGL